MRFLAVAFLVAAGFLTSEPGAAAEKGQKNPHLGRIRHVVLLQFKAATTPQHIAAIEAGFRDLSKKIREIVDLEWGTNVSEEKLDQGFTHCFVVTFSDLKSRDAYLPHPAHQAFVSVLKPCLEKVLVIDFVAKD